MRDYYSGQTDTVKTGKSRCNLPTATGFYCWNSASSASAPFNGATPPFILCLRIAFAMARATNDHSYGRHKDGMCKEIGTLSTARRFARVDEESTGLSHSSRRERVDETRPFEQITAGSAAEQKAIFLITPITAPAKDWTTLDANIWAAEADLRALVDGAHQRGIRGLTDVVMNHAGYTPRWRICRSISSARSIYPARNGKKIHRRRWTNWRPAAGQNWHSFNDYISFSDSAAQENRFGEKVVVPILATTTVRI
ncbi:hypothetical protein KCP75_19460 [Salmonella enterica subsp. enterica]|nr:hypothetical protein KCP75_19460 [Salmonella enterica subsp. enterica]